MEITEEMRRAVYAADCDRLGHQLEFSTAHAYTHTPDGGMRLAQSEEQLPHITCRRCPRVWLVVGEGWDYDDAERQLYGWLRADAEIARDIVRKRGRRDAGRRDRDEPGQT